MCPEESLRVESADCLRSGGARSLNYRQWSTQSPRKTESLLPSGILSVVGDFKSETVAIEDESDGNRRGLVNYHAEELRKIKGMHTEEAAAILQKLPGSST